MSGNTLGQSGSMGGNVPNLTAKQRDLAFFCDELAADLLPLLDSGERWFTAYKIRQKPEFLSSLVDTGIITIHKSAKHDGHYYKPTHLTRPFLLTALALREERRKLEQERASRPPSA